MQQINSSREVGVNLHGSLVKLLHLHDELALASVEIESGEVQGCLVADSNVVGKGNLDLRRICVGAVNAIGMDEPAADHLATIEWLVALERIGKRPSNKSLRTWLNRFVQVDMKRDSGRAAFRRTF